MKTSCLIFMYNGQKYIEEQILSIINQSVFLDEIIIVDDCSSDDSVIIVEQLMDRYPNSNLILEKNIENLGVIKTVEKGISLSTGDLIFFSDQDDVWIENKVEVFLDYAKKYPEMNLFYSDGDIVDSNLNKITTLSEFFGWKLYSDAKRRLQAAIDLKNFIPGHSIIVRKDFVRRCLPIPSQILNYSDGWIANMSHYESSSILIPERLIKYRQHDFNLIGAKIGNKRKSIVSRFIGQLSLGLFDKYIFLVEKQYFELVNNYEINQMVKDRLIIRHNYFHSIKRSIEARRISEGHFLFTKELLMSQLVKLKCYQFLHILKLETILLIKLKFRFNKGGF